MTVATSYPDRLGHECEVVPGFAETVFSGSASGAGSGYRQTAASLTSVEATAAHLLAVRSRVALGVRLMNTLAPESEGHATLVIGAGAGEECFWLADQSRGRAEVVGVNLKAEIPFHDSCPGAAARAAGEEAADRAIARMHLRVDDICDSGLGAAQFDRIFSWQTFEHVMDLERAFGHVARVLRPGGAAFIEYNPFFSIDGAHWPATIDIPWAHARMTPEVFAEAVAALHPSPRPDAASFVERAINRATQSEILAIVARSGLRVAAHLPRVRTEDTLVLDRRIFEAVRAGFPSVTALDLTSRIVRLVLTKPGEAS